MGEIHPACAVCKGACCESLALPIADNDPDVVRWFSYRGSAKRGLIQIEAPCVKLEDGHCSIYNNRPNVCRTFEVGGDGCRSAVVRRRPERANEILRLIVRGDK